MLELHRSRFVEWQPSPIVAMAVAPGGLTVALARETGDLEIYDTTDWRCTARVPGHDGAAVSCLAWCAPYNLDADDDDSGGGGAGSNSSSEAVACRLLSAGLDGQITEWDLSTLRPKGATDSHGGSVWAMAAEPAPRKGAPQRVAVACDDGCVRLLTLMAGDGVGKGLHHRRSFNRVQGRLLSLAWGHGGSAIAAGSSSGSIHVFDVETLSELTRITVGGGDRPAEAEERCVWALQYLPCGTIVSGSSDGDVTFWDGNHGTQLSSFRQHRADVLALASSPDGGTVFAAGIDSQIAVFEKLDDALGDDAQGMNRWTFTGAKRPHTHDVRALAMAAAPPSEGAGSKGGTNGGHGGGAILLSGGNDAQLLAYPAASFRKRHPVRVVSVPQRTPLAMTGGGTWTAPSKTPAKGKKKGGTHHVAVMSPQPGTPSPPLLLCDHARWVDVWRLGEGMGGGPGGAGAGSSDNSAAVVAAKGGSGMMKLSAAPLHVLRANLGGNKRTLCSAMSPDGGDATRMLTIPPLSKTRGGKTQKNHANPATETR
jgi:U3 small nucleolar RNA-associated protein 4